MIKMLPSLTGIQYGKGERVGSTIDTKERLSWTFKQLQVSVLQHDPLARIYKSTEVRQSQSLLIFWK